MNEAQGEQSEQGSVDSIIFSTAIGIIVTALGVTIVWAFAMGVVVNALAARIPAVTP